jgi:hypothetical protein
VPKDTSIVFPLPLPDLAIWRPFSGDELFSANLFRRHMEILLVGLTAISFLASFVVAQSAINGLASARLYFLKKAG